MTGSAWTSMSFFNARIVNNGSCCISPRISDQSSANDNTQRLAKTETTEQHGNFLNAFHFQNDQMWPVNMTGKTKGWPVNSQISSDIVRWPAVISSPGFLYKNPAMLRVPLLLSPFPIFWTFLKAAGRKPSSSSAITLPSTRSSFKRHSS